MVEPIDCSYAFKGGIETFKKGGTLEDNPYVLPATEKGWYEMTHEERCRAIFADREKMVGVIEHHQWNEGFMCQREFERLSTN